MSYIIEMKTKEQSIFELKLGQGKGRITIKIGLQVELLSFWHWKISQEELDEVNEMEAVYKLASDEGVNRKLDSVSQTTENGKKS